MNYTKPEVALGGPALTMIQGGQKPNHPNQDNDSEFNCTSPAYEADE